MSSTDYAANFEAFLKQRDKSKPFCFWYGGHEPHRRYAYGSGVALEGKSLSDIDRVPLYWPDTRKVRNDMLDYAFEIAYFAKHLGRMIAALERAGELDNTVIVVTADNGMPFPRAKGTTYELSLHEPLAIRWPGGIKQPGRKVDDYVSFIDFAPTFLEFTGLTEKRVGMEPCESRSLMPILRDAYDGRIEPVRNILIFGQERHDIGRPNDEGYPVRGIFSGNFLYLHNFEPSRWPTCDPVTGYLNTNSNPTKTEVLEENRRGENHWRWELDFGRRPAEELYDLKQYPDCMKNLAGHPAYAAQKTTMRDQLMATLKKQSDPCMEGKRAILD